MNKQENVQFLLLEKQKNTRKNVIEQYVKFRKDRNLTQEELAGIIGVSRPSISRFESGDYNPTLDMMVKIAEGLELNLDISLKQKEGEENEQ
ncbi:helix-turn-helix domain-containing protein [Blautia sp. An81]|uniref:helix-turn-helix domain-containing protein n=1 Tax=Blautia sp. An81 TaxID=1965659 RepID=UPI000B382702|nr:helix-turn-helix transcriptional regulator [Blautia sp. An81]OUN25150.1 hypothetical protein B5G33_18555 [Blautia sp. An81]